MKFRASQLGKLMTSPRSKVDRFSKTAESYIITIAKQDFYGYNTDQSTNKYCLKGIHQEQDSIDLLNAVRFESYKKNEQRLENEWLTGSCDIITDELIIDVKTSWSLDTFPATSYELKDLSDYEWQGRAYMWLYDMPTFELCYVMVSTADDILSDYDSYAIHKVDHIDPAKRITSIRFERDKELEIQMAEKLIAATEFYKEVLTQLQEK
jgi:hypothetical protein